jgi:competence protein ComEC
VGDNDYGHPAPDVLAALEAAGAEVLRTDTSGDVLVVPEGDAVVAVTR